MPQVDLDTLASICSGGDRKIACEPLHATREQPLHDSDDGVGEKKKPDLPDSPPESFWLSRDAEFDWFDRNAFYERKDSSGKGSNSTNLNPNLNHPTSNSSSQRFSRNLKAKAKIIGLPKTQKASYVDATTNRRNCRKKPANARFFNSGSGKSKGLVEPSSPKVSCIGRVRSKRGRKKVSRGVEEKKKKAVEEEERSRMGMYGRFMAMFFRSRKRRTAAGQATPTNVLEEDSLPARRSVESVRSFRGEPPGLGGMTRFASGRRSASSWTGDE